MHCHTHGFLKMWLIKKKRERKRKEKKQNKNPELSYYRTFENCPSNVHFDSSLKGSPPLSSPPHTTCFCSYLVPFTPPVDTSLRGFLVMDTVHSQLQISVFPHFLVLGSAASVPRFRVVRCIPCSRPKAC